MDTLFCSSNNSFLTQTKYVKEVGILVDAPPIGPEGQICFFLNEPSLIGLPKLENLDITFSF